MSKKTVKSPITEDISAKLSASEELVNDAVGRVWKRFESAMDRLEPAQREMLEEFLSGKPLAEVGKSRELTADQTRDCLEHIKREVVQHLRSNCKVRH